MTLFFPSHTITIRRLRSAGNGKSNYSATFTSYMADIQPADPNRVEQAGGRIGAMYEAWVDADVDIKEGDQIDSGGKRYSVSGIEYFQGAGLLDHKHLMLKAQNG